MTTLMQASHQWATRPADQRFLSLTELAAHVKMQRDRSHGAVFSNQALEARPVEEDGTGRALIIQHRDSGLPLVPSHFAFGQLASKIEAPAAYLRTLPADMAADCVNFGLAKRGVEELGVLLRKEDPNALPDLAAVTGKNYGRVWNDEVASALVKGFGDGRNGAFRVPGEFGEEVEVTRANTTLYAGDRDMFVFLADERNRIEMPNRRNGEPGSLARGFFVWNSEVGAQTLGIAKFLFDYVCCNRIVWGAEGFKEIRIRHTSGAPDRWLQQVTPALQRYADASAHSITDAVVQAQAAKIGDTEAVTEFLNKRFTKKQAAAIKLAHEAEEQRPIESLWDAVTGATAYARSIEFQDERVGIERIAGSIMQLAADKVSA